MNAAQKLEALNAKLDAAMVAFNEAKGSIFEELRWQEALEVLNGYTWEGTPA